LALGFAGGTPSKKWGKRLIGAENFMRSHCWTMIVAEVIQSAPEKTSQ
jgi:hypothetical protein